MIYKALAEIEEKNQAGAFCIVIHAQGSTPRGASSKMVVYPDSHIVGTVGGVELEYRVIAEALKAIKDGKPCILVYSLLDPQRGDAGVCGGLVEVYVEPIKPKPTLVVIGSGHVGRAVASLARWLGFRVVINDDRAECASPQSIPDADEYWVCPMQELPQKFEITAETYLVLTTRGFAIDVPGLPALLETPAAYIGVIGSRRRWSATYKELKEAGVPEEKLARVHSPVGLELNAETPEEIAVSILAEIIMLQRGCKGGEMRASQSLSVG